ncbi:MAG: hemerythrin domain-containing protein [Tetrasphaera sp.]
MCSYCGCDQITIIGRFMAEHVDVINALTALRAACHADDRPAVVPAVDAMIHVLDPHTHAEEVGLFTVMRRDPVFTDHIASLCAEHTQLDDVLAEIRGGAHERFDAFEHALRVHIDREDNGLFPAAAVAMSGADWDEIEELTPAPGSFRS